MSQEFTEELGQESSVSGVIFILGVNNKTVRWNQDEINQKSSKWNRDGRREDDDVDIIKLPEMEV